MSLVRDKMKYTFSIRTVNKYCFYGPESESDTIESEIDDFYYHPDYVNYLKVLISKVPAIEPHIGNLLCIMELFISQEQSGDQYSFLAAELLMPLKRMHVLQKLLESPDRELGKVDIIVNLKPTSPLSSDFITSEVELNKILIAGLLRDYKKYFDDTYQDLFFTHFNRVLVLENISANELYKIVEVLEQADFNYRSHKINFEKEMIQVVLNYLNNETDLNPRGQKMNKPLATVIYYILFIFKVITKPQKENDITNYIRDTHKNSKRAI